MNVPSFHRSIEYTYKYEHILCSGMRSACYSIFNDLFYFFNMLVLLFSSPISMSGKIDTVSNMFQPLCASVEFILE